MGQAKLRKAAAAAGNAWPADRPLPKDLIARAVRKTFQRVRQQWHSGTCAYQAEVGRRILRGRYGLECLLQVGDFQRPWRDGMCHTYTREDGLVNVETGACHAWIYSRTTNEIIDFAAWETPLSFKEAGHEWPGDEPDYLWDPPDVLVARGFTPQPDGDATMFTIRKIVSGVDADVLNTWTEEALKAIRSAQ